LVRIIFNIILFLSLVSCSASAQNIAIYADVNGNDSLQKLVTILTGQLKKSGSFEFTVQPVSSYQGKGIYLSTASGSRLVRPSAKLLNSGVEAFSVDADQQGVQILGNCNMAVGHGIFSYLDFLGYRFYFANPDWHIVPSRPVLFRKWNIVSAPSFNHRRMIYGYGTGSKIADEDYRFWVMANKLGGSMNASYGHSYEDIAWRNKEAFFQHPEWFYPVAPKGTIPSEAKLDMTKEDLVQLIIRDVEKRIETSLKNKTNDYKMISLGPSDGVGTCNTPACQQLGTYTDRVYYLANRVAKAIQKKYPSTLIGCLAYTEYISPPTRKIEPNIYVSITTAFNTSKYSTEQLVDEWRKKATLVGIYDFFSWYAWDYDIPGRSLASKPRQLIASIKKYHAKGVKGYEGESSIGWISKGVGYYLAARQMWDINADPAPRREEFFNLCFGKAANLMRTMWNEWEKYSFTTIREGSLARWIDYVNEAEKVETSEKVMKRFFQIKSYLHYLSLFHNYQLAKNEANLSAVLNFGYRKLDDGSVAGFPAFYELGNRSGIPGMAYDDKAKWKSNNSPVTMEEINRLLNQDRSKLKVFEPIKEFQPATKFATIPRVERYGKLLDSSNTSNGYWYTNEWVIEIKKKGVDNYIDLTGNFINDPSVTRPIKISVYPFTADGDVAGKTPLVYYEYKATKVKERISFGQLNPGYYSMLIEDPVKQFIVSISPPINYSMVIRATRPLQTTALNYAFIYVPEGVKKFNVMKTSLLHFVTPTGREISYMTGEAKDLQIDVKPGEAGLWRISPVYDQFFVEGIPPYLGTSPQRMLIPAGLK
jgi:hypothetical protein